MPSIHVAGLSGSLRANSHSRTALDHALAAAEDAGATVDRIDLRTLDLPQFDADADEPRDAKRLTARVRDADSILLSTPVYHGSYSSVLKSAIDYCGFDEFEGKTVGLMAVSGGRFPLTALDHLRTVCRALDAWVIPHEAAVPQSSEQFEDGEFVDEAIERRVWTLGRQAVGFANIEPGPPCPESIENVGAGD